MRNFYKNGMTLGELCIVFAIMGVIASMTIISAKPYEKSLKYSYEKVYNNLETAFYNSQLNFKTELRNITQTDKDTWFSNNGTFPTNAATFCYLVFGYINTAQGSGLCKTTDDYKFKPAIAEGTADTVDESLEGASTLIASNGVRYWIAKPTENAEDDFSTINYRQGEDNTNTTCNPQEDSNCFSTRFYIVYVDLNGKMPPNTTKWTEKKPADIVPFIVTENADVIPMGAPILDARYLTALVEYNSFTTDANGEQKQEYSQPMTFYEAMRYAWATASGENLYDNLFTTTDNSMTIKYYQLFDYEHYPTLYPPNSLKNTHMKGLTYDKVNCGRRDDPNQLDPNACTIKIKNYF